MGIRLPERAALALSAIAFCLASLLGLSVGVPLPSAGLRGMVAAGVFGIVGYSFGRALVNVIGEDVLHKPSPTSMPHPQGAEPTPPAGEAKT